MTTHSPRLIAWSRRLAPFCLIMLLAMMAGCHALTPSEPTRPVASYARGDLEARLPGDFRRVVQAAKGALAELELGLISESQDAEKALVVSRTPGDKRIEINIDQAGNALSRIKIRVGMFGDEQVARKIFDRIQARLAATNGGG